ncbi:MAG: hypothetical protein Q9M25_05540 [Mariprofundaceae bacterium]|nr:hypothetical protein [Mariprofundaceae bacterium]
MLLRMNVMAIMKMISQHAILHVFFAGLNDIDLRSMGTESIAMQGDWLAFFFRDASVQRLNNVTHGGEDMKNKSYLKGVFLGFSLIVAVVVAPSISPVSMQLQYPQAVADEGSMAKIQLILRKLRSSMSSMKDFDELEKVGMPKSDVDRMRRAMTRKIKQLTDEAINSIRAL